MTTKITTNKLDTSVSHDVSESFTLPDYLPTVKKILSCVPSVLPESRFAEEGRINLSGIVIYTVYYMGEDSTLNAVGLNSEYSVALTFKSDEVISPDALFAVTYSEGTSCRATAPRTLQITSKLRTKGIVAGSENVTERIIREDGNADSNNTFPLERKTVPVTFSTAEYVSSSGELSGEFRERENSKIISCSGSAVLSDVRCDKGEAVFRGEAFVEYLMEDAESGYFSGRIKAPFERRVVGNFAKNGGMSATASGVARCASVHINGKDGGVFEWNLEYDIEGIVSSDGEALVTDDVYSCKNELSCEKNSIKAMSQVKCQSSRLSVSGTKALSGNMLRNVINSSAQFIPDRCECSLDGKILLNGICTLTVIMSGEDTLESEQIQIPVKYESECKRELYGTPCVICSVETVFSDGRADSSKLSGECELAISLIVFDTEKRDYISEIMVKDELSQSKTSGEIVLCFPFESGNVWEIGKKYHCEQAKISPVEGSSALMITRF